MAKESAKDLFLNFASVKANYGNPTTTLVTAKLGTSLSIRGALGWLIHLVQWWMTDDLPLGIGTPCTLWAALSTKSGLVGVPAASADGCIDYCSESFIGVTSGASHISRGDPRAFAPPIPLAAPEIHLYIQADNDGAGYRGNLCEARIGYTTTPMTGNLWQEVAEVWGW